MLCTRAQYTNFINVTVQCHFKVLSKEAQLGRESSSCTQLGTEKKFLTKK